MWQLISKSLTDVSTRKLWAAVILYPKTVVKVVVLSKNIKAYNHLLNTSHVGVAYGELSTMSLFLFQLSSSTPSAD